MSFMHYDRRGQPVNLWTWCALNEMHMAYKRIARTTLTDSLYEWEVSTVWIGIDMSYGFGGPPILFESMVFGDGCSMDRDCQRYATEDEAREGHAGLVTLVRATMDDPLIAEHDDSVLSPPYGTRCTLGYNEERFGGYILLGTDPADALFPREERDLPPLHTQDADGYWWPTHEAMRPFEPADFTPQTLRPGAAG